MQLITRKQAQEQGLKRYFTGEPCPYGHIAERFTKGAVCYACSDAKAKQWAIDNAERKKQIQKTYRIENAEVLKQAARAYYIADTETYKARSKRSVEARREDVRVYMAEYAKTYPKDKKAATNRRWRQNNPAIVNAATARRRCSLLQRTVAWSDESLILPFYEEAARLTELTGVPHEVDHIYPLQGELVSGLHVHTNLRVIAMAANRKKGNK